MMDACVLSSVAPQITELYFSDRLPEPHLVWGVRAFVFDHENRLLFIQESDNGWVLPGGGRDTHETPEQTVHREVAEEACVLIKSIEWVAYEKFIVNGPKPDHYKRYYPVAYTAYARAEVDVLNPFTVNPESVARVFLTLQEAAKQDGIISKRRRIILDRIMESKGHEQIQTLTPP